MNYKLLRKTFFLSETVQDDQSDKRTHGDLKADLLLRVQLVGACGGFHDAHMASSSATYNTPAHGSSRPSSKQSPLLATRLVLLAACVRTAYLLLVVGAAHLIRDYDTSASLLSESCADDWPEQAAAAQQYLPGVVWDSVFLHRVSACGYEYEQFFAFYPGLPGGLMPGPGRRRPSKHWTPAWHTRWIPYSSTSPQQASDAHACCACDTMAAHS